MRNTLFSGIEKVFNLLACQQTQNPDYLFPNLVASILFAFQRLAPMPWEEILRTCSPVEIFVARYSSSFYHVIRQAYPLDAGSAGVLQQVAWGTANNGWPRSST